MTLLWPSSMLLLIYCLFVRCPIVHLCVFNLYEKWTNLWVHWEKMVKRWKYFEMKIFVRIAPELWSHRQLCTSFIWSKKSKKKKETKFFTLFSIMFREIGFRVKLFNRMENWVVFNSTKRKWSCWIFEILERRY